MSKKITHEEYVERVRIAHGSSYVVIGEYTRGTDKIKMYHKLCGKYYYAQASSIARGTCCPHCFGKKRKTTSQFKEEIYNIYGNEYTVLGEYKNAKTKIEVRHEKCGTVYSVVPDSLLRGNGCMLCSGSKKKTTESYKKELYDIVGSEYSLVGEYVKATQKVKIRHNSCGHEWYAIPRTLTVYKSGCPVCNVRKVERDTQWMIDKIKEVTNGEYETESEYTGIACRIKVKHLVCGHVYETNPNTIINSKSGCPACNLSRGETEIRRYLDKNGIKFVKEYKIKKDKKRYDFKVGNVLIEFDGEQHFIERVKKHTFFKGSLRDRQINDRYKTNLTLFYNYKLVRISYTEIKNVDKILDEVFSKGDDLEALCLYGKEYDSFEC